MTPSKQLDGFLDKFTPQIAAQASLVDREIGVERRLRRRPDAAEVLAGIGLGVLAGIFHGSPLVSPILQVFGGLSFCLEVPNKSTCRHPFSALRRHPTAICISAMRCRLC